VWLPGGGTAKLIHADVKDDGSLPIPQGLDEATWWGAKVGAAQGAALLSGHVNWKGKKGPFDELWRLKAGQEVAVADVAGGRWVYRVDEVLTVHKDNLAAQSEKLFSQDGPHRLVLVTCGGEYVGGTEGYEDNRIATASLVSRP
jgi:LPXTG-site transpeptidase (sortase) family protein